MINRQNLQCGTRPPVGNKILITSSDHFDGYQIMEYHGMVWGISIRAKDVGTDFIMGCKQTFGGELTSFTELADEGRQRAVDRMLEMARRIRANAIINFTFHNENVMGLTEVTAYGTAVIIEPIKDYVPVGAIGNILADIADYGHNTDEQSAKVPTEPKPEQIKPVVIDKKSYPLASLQLTGGKLFASCPNCNMRYLTTQISESALEVKGYEDTDKNVAGQQIKCENCGEIFMLPSISQE